MPWIVFPIEDVVEDLPQIEKMQADPSLTCEWRIAPVKFDAAPSYAVVFVTPPAQIDKNGVVTALGDGPDILELLVRALKELRDIHRNADSLFADKRCTDAIENALSEVVPLSDDSVLVTLDEWLQDLVYDDRQKKADPRSIGATDIP